MGPYSAFFTENRTIDYSTDHQLQVVPAEILQMSLGTATQFGTYKQEVHLTAEYSLIKAKLQAATQVFITKKIIKY